MEALELIGEVINDLEFPIKATSDIVNGVFTVDNKQYLRKGSKILVNGVKKTVKSITGLEITLTATTTNEVDPTITLPTLNFFHGTANMQSNEWSQIKAEDLKFPSIYAREIIREVEYPFNTGNILERESDITIYVSDVADFNRWTTDDHYANVIPNLRVIVKEFKKQLIKHKRSGKITDFENINRVNLGVYSDDRGNTSAIFNERISAIELGFTLPIYKKQIC